MNRRQFLAAGTALAAASPALAEWQPSQRYPDPLVRIVDPSFARYRLALAKVERIATGMRWCEGPVWFGDGRYLLVGQTGLIEYYNGDVMCVLPTVAFKALNDVDIAPSGRVAYVAGNNDGPGVVSSPAVIRLELP